MAKAAVRKRAALSNKIASRFLALSENGPLTKRNYIDLALTDLRLEQEAEAQNLLGSNGAKHNIA